MITAVCDDALKDVIHNMVFWNVNTSLNGAFAYKMKPSETKKESNDIMSKRGKESDNI